MMAALSIKKDLLIWLDKSRQTYMSLLKKIITLAFLLHSFSGVFSQTISNRGRDFWVGYGHHQYMETGANNQNMVIYLSAEAQPATVTVTIDSSGLFGPTTWYRKTYNIPAFSVVATEFMPKGVVNSAVSGTNPNFDARLYSDPPPSSVGGEQHFRRKGIHIESNVDIVAYAHIFSPVSSGSTMLLPVNTWGLRYTSINSEQRQAAGPAFSWMYVIAKEDNTVVRITPSVTSRLGKAAGVPFNVQLQKGQIYQLIGNGNVSSGDGAQLTGTTIESIPGTDGKCHPIGAFAGSSRTMGESSCGSSGRDNDIQQMFPEHSWGQRYATAPFSTSAGGTNLTASRFQTSIYKVVVSDPATEVRRNGVLLTGLILNKYYQFSSNTADLITADKPVMVGQFMSGPNSCNPGSDGDPAMVFLSPLEQRIRSAGFYRNDVDEIKSNYVTIIVPTAGLPSLRVDNSPTFNHTYAHPNLPGYSVAIKGWPAAKAQAIIRCDSGFNAVTYGLGSAESYAYNAGAAFDPLKPISGVTNNPGLQDSLNQFNCVGTPMKLSVLMLYKPGSLVISLDSLGNVVTPNAKVTLDPAVNSYQGTTIVEGITYHKYDLPGTYLFNTPGTYSVHVKATNPALGGCLSEDTFRIKIEVRPRAKANFTFVLPQCPQDSVIFTGDSLFALPYNINRWKWETPTGTIHTDTTRTVGHAFPGPGTYNVKLTVFTKDACNADTIKPVVLNPLNPINFTVSPVTLCQGNP
jgi:hypothetical protein